MPSDITSQVQMPHGQIYIIYVTRSELLWLKLLASNDTRTAWKRQWHKIFGLYFKDSQQVN